MRGAAPCGAEHLSGFAQDQEGLKDRNRFCRWKATHLPAAGQSGDQPQMSYQRTVTQISSGVLRKLGTHAYRNVTRARCTHYEAVMFDPQEGRAVAVVA